MNKALFALCFIFLYMTSFLFTPILANDKKNSHEDDEINYRHPSADQIEAYRNMKAYDYHEVKATESLWQRLIRWFSQPFARGGVDGKIIYYGFIIIGVIAIVFYLLKMYGLNPIGLLLFKKNKEVEELKFTYKDDDIYRQDLDKLLDACIRNNAYREAIRILYLLAIKKMDQAKLIDWKPWKTNRDYYYELRNKELADKFKRLVRSYEYIWYGQFVVHEDEFNLVKDDFQGFKSNILSLK